MKIQNLKIDGPIVITPNKYHDSRGFFREIYNCNNYRKHSSEQWLQTNHSESNHAAIRGLHYQKDEAKLISVISGAIFDVVVDLRRDSPTFGQWVGVTLTTSDQIYVPAGFAHGFCVLSKEPANVVYHTNQIWNKKFAGGLAWDDPDLNIDWPVTHPIISDKDLNNESFKDYVKNLDSRL